ncbi:hypothetical protein BV22DRAFT_1200257 [Leucogyrophana mollusca]|uniref:Uncharacterized protein n=1 Tax=Leucogyrophana mollusca TaxID=85980 RepID=A0ACB8AYF0_9AGAM|nr:hypothetical protein BV22DRAFT_1200257 [Leucogyrophana mollusca]
MHPFHHMYYGRACHGPSRIFWFIVGAGAATFWHCSREMRDRRGQYFSCVMQQRRIDAQAAAANAALMPPTIPTPPDYTQKPYEDNAPRPDKWGWRASWGAREGDGTVGWNQQEWEENKERMKNLQKRAEDAMVDMSESTLESIVSTAESLKAKLAEHRAQQKQQQKLYEEELERQKKEPRRYV